jgi:S-adenosylmethionine:tRNA ribosyltransferase-isomerase
MSSSLLLDPATDRRAAQLAGGTLRLSFDLDGRHVATAPPEVRGRRRDDVRLMVSRGQDSPTHHVFTDLPAVLEPGDLVVVNTSGTIPAAIDAIVDTRRDADLVVHVSTALPGGLWLVEPRRVIANGSSEPIALPATATTAHLAGGVDLALLRPSPGSRRLWLATVERDLNGDIDLIGHLCRHGRAIRYPYVGHDWPIDHYQTVFADHPGSAEMPSAARPFTADVVAALVRRGIGLATLQLHTGVSSLEGHEVPYPERYVVPPSTAAAIDATRALGRRVIAVGTTVVRALETVAAGGHAHAGTGWTDLVITPERGVMLVDGLLTGWHEPGASHLALLEAVAGRDALLTAYEEAWRAGYLWHEFGDSHLLLPVR